MSDLKERTDRAHGMFCGTEPMDYEFVAKTFKEAIDAVQDQFIQMKAALAEYTNPFTDEFGQVWEPVTPYQHAQVCRAHDAWKKEVGRLQAGILSLYRGSQK